VHIAALGAIPFFTWESLAVCLLLLFIVVPLGINVGYHRLLTHRAFEAPRWVRNTLVTIGAAAAAGPPLHWAALHRIHHRYSDSAKDPHNSQLGFWHSHAFHLFRENEFEKSPTLSRDYSPDLVNDRYLVFLNKYWIWVAIAMLPLLYLAGGISYLMWGGFVRVVLSWHVMWLVNSASHLWGYRNYETRDTTVNCWWVGILAAGEGWHNNHHAFPTDAAHGHRWWELDLSFAFIKLLERLGLAKNVKRPSLAKMAKFNDEIVANLNRRPPELAIRQD
jgi:stearoyl-CoA desaturase (delta-9 desaturase)